MVKRTQAIRRLLPTNCLSMFDHFVGLTLKGLNKKKNIAHRQAHSKKKLAADRKQDKNF